MNQRPVARSPRTTMLGYGRHSIDPADLDAVCDVLRGDWLTGGPTVARFESRIAEMAGTRHAVAVANGTAALHAMMAVLGVGPGDEVIVPAITFVASSNAVLYVGATPVFADVDSDTLLIDPDDVARRLTPRTKAVLTVDYAGQPCDHARLRDVLPDSVTLLVDGCHAFGAADVDGPVGSLGRMTAFSFHPVKPITTGEGGAVTTDDDALATALRSFRNHGISVDGRTRMEAGSWHYDMDRLGFNYRLTDIQAALGLSQMDRLDDWIDRRNAIADRYDAAFAGLDGVHPLKVRDGVRHGRHLYVVRIGPGTPDPDPVLRDAWITRLREQNIGANLHYTPPYQHSHYRGQGITADCPVADRVAQQIITLPLHPGMGDDDIEDVIHAVQTNHTEFRGNA